MSDLLKTPELVDTRYRIPAFWERSIVYFANLKSLFFGNDEQTKELANQVGEIDSYGGRLASVLNLIYRGDGNVLILEREPDADLLRYFETALGLKLPRLEILSHKDYSTPAFIERLARQLVPKDARWVDGYVTDDILSDWALAVSAKTISTQYGSRWGNNKTELFRFMESQGLPTPDTHVAETEAGVLMGLEWLKRAGYQRAVVRAALGASGIGMLKVELAGDYRVDLPSMLFHGGPCLVQGWFEPGVLGTRAVSSPSVQLFLDDTCVQMFDVTDQILSADSVHEGNQSPPAQVAETLRSELIRQAGLAGSWLHRQGYRGTASVDFLVVESEGRQGETVYICEVNARITGATYPSVLGRSLLPGGAWLMQNLRLEEPIEGKRLLGLLEASRLLFSKGDARGVVPINFNFDRDGLTRKGQFLCLAASVAECRTLLQEMVDGLPFKTTAERD